MSRFVRLLVAFFLAFAVPIQGLAGVTMASCSGTQLHAVLADGRDAVAMEHATHGEAAHAGAMSHAHHGTGGELADSHASHHNCAACAACCNLSAAPVPAVAAVAADRPSSLPIAFLETVHASVQARALERPPSVPFLG